jgi:hypothetical protein
MVRYSFFGSNSQTTKGKFFENTEVKNNKANYISKFFKKAPNFAGKPAIH